MYVFSKPYHPAAHVQCTVYIRMYILAVPVRGCYMYVHGEYVCGGVWEGKNEIRKLEELRGANGESMQQHRNRVEPLCCTVSSVLTRISGVLKRVGTCARAYDKCLDINFHKKR